MVIVHVVHIIQWVKLVGYVSNPSIFDLYIVKEGLNSSISFACRHDSLGIKICFRTPKTFSR